MLKAQYDAFREYQERKAANPAIDPFIVHKMTTTVVKAVGEAASRRLGITISRSTPDRSKDTVSHTGWVTDNYKLNPVVLWAHDYKMLPVGKSVDLSVIGDGLHSVDQFVEPELSAFGDTVYRMLLLGYLNATSVGFDPWEWSEAKDRDDGTSWFVPCNFTKQELLEHSVVPVPAHPGALVDAKSKGLNVAPIEEWTIRTLDEWSEQKGFVIPQEMVYAAAKELNPRSFHLGVTLAPSGEPRQLTPAEAFHAALKADLLESQPATEEEQAMKRQQQQRVAEQPPAGKKDAAGPVVPFIDIFKAALKAARGEKDAVTGAEEAPEVDLATVAIEAVNQLIAMEAADLATDPDEAQEISLLLRIREMLCNYADGDMDGYWYLAMRKEQRTARSKAENPDLDANHDPSGNNLDGEHPESGTGKKPDKTPGADDAPDEQDAIKIAKLLGDRLNKKLREEVAEQYTAKTGRLI